MLLSGYQIIQNGLIHNYQQECVRAASYNVRIDAIILRDRNGHTISTDNYELPPQGMVEVVSIERVSLPKEIAGYATVKTSLSDHCVLALGIGLIDPTYNSFISSTLVNFGTQPFRLEQGDVFLRLTFHQYEPAHNVPEVNSPSHDAYLRDKRDKVMSNFSETFLNLRHTVREAFRGAVWRVVGFAAFTALVVTVVTAASGLGISLLGAKLLPPSTESQQLLEQRNKQFAALERDLAAETAQLKQLADKQQQLQSDVENLKNRLLHK